MAPTIRQLDRWTRPCFCFRHPKGFVPPTSEANPSTRYWAGFSPFFVAPDRPFQGRRTLYPCLNRLTERWFWNPFGSDRRDPKLTRAEQEEG